MACYQTKKSHNRSLRIRESVSLRTAGAIFILILSSSPLSAGTRDEEYEIDDSHASIEREIEQVRFRTLLDDSPFEQALLDSPSDVVPPEFEDIVEEEVLDQVAYGVHHPVDASDINMPPPKDPQKATVAFPNAFELKSDDGEFSLQFHNLTQVDGRFYGQPNQNPVRDTFEIPRQWFIFSGKLTTPIEYFAAAAFGFDTLNLLDSFINFHSIDEVQFKVGRFKTPFTYEFFALPIQGLINPERSLFFNNFALNRDIGGMVHGSLWDKKFDYAAGMFNGSRNGFVDLNDGKEFAGYLNARPFGDSCGGWLEHLNIGASTMFGDNNQVPVPSILRTSVATTGAGVNGIPFLTFNPGVTEQGMHAFYSAHAAYYHGSLSLISELSGGHQAYSLDGVNQDVNVHAYYIQTGYFLTGEQVTMRNVPKPNNDFDPGCGGWGAWELTYRYNYLSLGDNIFTGGYANPALWTNNLNTNDVGMNWYPNQWVKIMWTWEHANFGSPVVYNTTTGDQFNRSNTYWLRTQLYF